MQSNEDLSIRDNKTVLIVLKDPEERSYLKQLLEFEDYRIVDADNLLSLIEAVYHYHIDLIIADVDMPGISMADLLSYLRKRFYDIKVILSMKEYSPELELRLRPYKILYVMTWPIGEELLKSIIARGLKIDRARLAFVNS
jgi:DNA-binding NtrC family response regulator